METTNVLTEKIKTICGLLDNLNIYEKASIINWLSDDIEMGIGEKLTPFVLSEMLNRIKHI